MPKKTPRAVTVAMVAGWTALLLMPLAVTSSAAPAKVMPATATATAPAPSNPPATRCGWFDNPTPGNATLTDRDGEWLLGQQGGHQASGNWPQFSRARWVRTGRGSAGYGCACIRLVSQPDTQDVQQILSARSLPLATCRNDKALEGLEPQNPLK